MPGGRGGGFDIDPVSLQASGAELARVTARMADELTALEAAVSGSHPWGADETGTAFGVAYTAVLGHALQALGTHVEQVGFAALGLSTQARTVAQADAENAQGFRGLDGEGAP